MVRCIKERQTTPVFLPGEPHEQSERQKDMEDEPPGQKVSNGERVRVSTNSFRKNGVAGPKLKRLSVVDVSCDESKVQCYKEQYCIGIWNVKSMNQGKLEVVKQEVARVNINI